MEGVEVGETDVWMQYLREETEIGMQCLREETEVVMQYVKKLLKNTFKE